MKVTDISNVLQELETRDLDPNVGIAIKPVEVGTDIGLYVARIDPGKKVRPHYHPKVNEIYEIFRGEGVMHTASVVGEMDGKYYATWEGKEQVKEGKSFNIEEGVGHCLENTGNKPLILKFICPPSHLTDKNRYFIENMPE